MERSFDLRRTLRMNINAITNSITFDFSVREIYYDENNIMVSWGDAVKVSSEDCIEDLDGYIDMIIESKNKPLLFLPPVGIYPDDTLFDIQLYFNHATVYDKHDYDTNDVNIIAYLEHFCIK
jgi:hypothetical protein